VSEVHKMAVLGWRGRTAVFGCGQCGRLVEVDTGAPRHWGDTGTMTVVDEGWAPDASHHGSAIQGIDVDDQD